MSSRKDQDSTTLRSKKEVVETKRGGYGVERDLFNRGGTRYVRTHPAMTGQRWDR